MGLTLFAQNLLESATVTISVPASAAVLSRLYDRDHSAIYQAGNAWSAWDTFPISLAQAGPIQIDIDIDLGTAQPVSGWAFVNHNVAGVAVSLRGDASFPASSVRDSVTPATATDFLRTFGSQPFRYWRFRIPPMAVPLSVGEILLGVPREIRKGPFRRSPESSVGNVARDRSPAGFPWNTKKGAERARLEYQWPGMPAADLAQWRAAHRETSQGAKALLVKDGLGVLRWMTWEGDRLTWEKSGRDGAGDVYQTAGTFEEVPK